MDTPALPPGFTRVPAGACTFHANDKAVLVFQVLGRDDIAGIHIIVDEGAFIDGDGRTRAAPSAGLKNGILPGNMKDRLLRSRHVECGAPRENRRVICIPNFRPAARARAARSPVARVPSRSCGRTPPAPPRWPVAARTLRHRRPGHPTSARMDSPPLRPSFKRIPADARTSFCTCIPACRPATRALAAHSPRSSGCAPPAPPSRPIALAHPSLAAQGHPAPVPVATPPLPLRFTHASRPTPAPASRRAVRAFAARSPGALAPSRSPHPARSVAPPPPPRWPAAYPIPRPFRARAPSPRSSTRLRCLWDFPRASPPMPASASAPAPLLAARPTPSPRAPALAPSRLSGCAHPAPPLWPNAPSRTPTLPPPGQPIPCR